MKKVVVVMTHFERPYQLSQTLRSLCNTKHPDFEVVVVDDGSKREPRHSISSYPITVIRTGTKTWTNPEPAYNKGLAYAMTLDPDVIIVQNAECYHVNDVISRAAEVTDDDYFSFACYSIDQRNTFRMHEIGAIMDKDNRCATNDGQNAWYNHPVHRPVGYDFCAAITAKNMKALNGYDERLSAGCGYGDNYLLERVKMLGLKVQIITNPMVVHQWHYDQPAPKNKAVLVERNRLLYLRLLTLGQPRAVHQYTPDL